jgi:hypothetical protein
MKKTIQLTVTTVLLAILSAMTTEAIAQLDGKTKKQLSDSLQTNLKGQRRWLKVDVLKKTGLMSGDDITYVREDATIQYKTLNSDYSKVIGTSVDDFIAKVLKDSPSPTINLFERGTPVILHAIKFDEKKEFGEVEIKIGITDEMGDKSAVKFLFSNTDLTMGKIQNSLAVVFADTDWSDEAIPRAYAKKLVGEKRWLKIDAVSITENARSGGSGAAYFFPGGKVYYKIQYYTGLKEWSYQTESVAELENEVRHRLKNYSTEIWSKGTQVTIEAIIFLEKWKKSDYHAEIKISDFRDKKTSIKVGFDFTGNIVEQFQRAVALAFADTEGEQQETQPVTTLSLGMTIDEVIKIKGQPKTRADLGAKTVFTYDDMKIVFQDGKLSDVQ